MLVARLGTETVSVRENKSTSTFCDAVPESRLVCVFSMKTLESVKARKRVRWTIMYMWNGNMSKICVADTTWRRDGST